MLDQFRFVNFKSFKDEAILDLTASKVTELGRHIVSVGNEKILPGVVVFGANGSGKTNLVEAFRFMVNYVLNSCSYGGIFGDKHRPKLTPFLLDPLSRNLALEFEVYFTRKHGGKERFWNYGFTVGIHGVEEEWLNTRAPTMRKYSRVFYRNLSDNELNMDGLPKASRENVAMVLQDESLLLSVGAMLNVDIMKSAWGWFADCEFIDEADLDPAADLSSIVPDGFVKDKEVRDRALAFMRAFDKSIAGFDVKTKLDDSGDEVISEIMVQHREIGSDKTCGFKLFDEASGTVKLLWLYKYMERVMSRGGVLVVDEVDTHFHTLVTRALLIGFLNPKINPNRAQIICTAHDTWQLENNILRRDEIWFVEKDKDGCSSLYPLSCCVDVDGVKIRKDENFEKNYLVGKYGAVPALHTYKVVNG